MKYAFTGLIVLLFATSQAQVGTGVAVEQPTPASKWGWGVKGDLTFNNILGNGMGAGYVAGGELGGFVKLTTSKKWAFQGELLGSLDITKRGNDFLTYYNTNGYAFSNESIKLFYVNVPLLVRYKLNDLFTLVAGPQVGFLVNDNENLLNYNQRAFKTYAVSGNVGGELTLNNVAFFLRYNQGITNINDVDNRYTWRAQHVALGIAVGIK